MWAAEHFVRPDMIVFGRRFRYAGSCAAGGSTKSPITFFAVPSRVNSTWAATSSDMVRSQTLSGDHHEDRLIENASAVGSHLQKGLNDLPGEFPGLVSNARAGALCVRLTCGVRRSG